MSVTEDLSSIQLREDDPLVHTFLVNISEPITTAAQLHQPTKLLWNLFKKRDNELFKAIDPIFPQSFGDEAGDSAASEKKKDSAKKRAHFDESSEPIIDIQMVASKKMFTELLEECGYHLITKNSEGKQLDLKDAAAKKNVYFSYLRDSPEANPEGKEEIKGGFFTRRKKNKPKWTPKWMKDNTSPTPITHLSFCIKSASHTAPGFICVHKNPAGESAGLQYAGAEIPSYFSFRRGFGPQLSTLQFFDSQKNQLRKDFYFAGKAIDIFKDGTQRMAGFRLNFTSILEEFEKMTAPCDLVFSEFFACMLVTLYSVENKLVMRAIDTIKSMQSSIGAEGAKFNIPVVPLNFFLIQLSELALTLYIREEMQLLNALLEVISQLIVKNINSVWPSTTTHFFYTLLVTVFDNMSESVSTFLPQLCQTFVQVNSDSKVYEQTVEYDFGMGCGPEKSNMYDSMRQWTIELVKTVAYSKQTSKLFDTLFLRSSETGSTGSIATDSAFMEKIVKAMNSITLHRFKGEKRPASGEKHIFGILLLLSRVIAEPMPKSPKEKDDLNIEYLNLNDTIAEEAIANAAAHAIASSSKKSTNASMIKEYLQSSKMEWNSLLNRKMFAIETIQLILAFCEDAAIKSTHPANESKENSNIYTQAKQAVLVSNPLLVRALRLAVIPAVVEFIWWAIKSDSGRSIAFRSALKLFKLLWNTEAYHVVLQYELGLIYDRLLLGILNDDVDVSEIIESSLLAGKIDSDNSASALENISKKAVDITYSLKLDILDCIDKMTNNAQKCIDMFVNHDLNTETGSSPLFERTYTVLCALLRKFDYSAFATAYSQDVLGKTISDDQKSMNDKREDFLDDVLDYDEGNLKVIVDELYGDIRNERERIALSALFLITRVLEKLADRVSIISAPEKKVYGLRRECIKLLSLERLDLALRHIFLFCGEVEDAGLIENFMDHKEVELRKKHTVNFSFKQTRWRPTIEVQDELALLFYHSAKSQLISPSKITDFLCTGNGLPSGFDVVPEFLDAVTYRYINLIWKYHVNIRKKRNIFKCIKTIFESHWLTLPSELKLRKNLLAIFSTIFHSSLSSASDTKKLEEVDKQLNVLTYEQIYILCMALTIPMDRNQVKQIVQIKSPIRENVQVFLHLLREAGKELGLVGGDSKKISLPKILVDHLSDQYFFSMKKLFRHDSFSNPPEKARSPSIMVRKSVLILKGSKENLLSKLPIPAVLEESKSPSKSEGCSYHENEYIDNIMNALCTEKMVNRAFPGFEYEGSRSYRLAYHMLEATWHLFLPIFAEVATKMQFDAWRRDEAIETLFMSLDGLVGGILISVAIDNESIMDSLMQEFAKIRYLHSHYRDEKASHNIATGKFIESQNWIENVRKLSVSDKEQASNQLRFILDSTKAQIEFNYEQDRVKDLQTRMQSDINFHDGKRIIQIKGKLLKGELGSSKLIEEVVFLFSDLLITAVETKPGSGILKLKSLYHLSIVTAMTYAEAVSAGYPVDNLRTLVKGSDERCIIISSRSSTIVLLFYNKSSFEEWRTQLKDCARDSQSSHLEQISNRSSSSQNNSDSCYLCLKNFSRFQKPNICDSCNNSICSNCSSSNSEGKPKCDACTRMSR